MQNPMHAHRLAVATAFAALLTAGTAVPVFAASGTWTPTVAGTYSWDTPANWTSNTIADGSGFTATFTAGTTGSQTITLDSSRDIGALVFGNHAWRLEGANTLTLIGTATPTITGSTQGVIITTTLAGNQGVSISGGNVSLQGDNTFSGAVSVTSGGSLILAHANALGTGNGEVSVSTNSEVVLADGITISGRSITAAGTGKTTSGTLVASGAGEWAGTVSLAANARIGTADATSQLTVSGVISDGTANNLFISGLGTTVLSGANTYTGTTHVYRGVLKLDAGNNRLPTGTALILGGTTNNARFDLNGWSQTVASIETGSQTSVRTITNSSSTTSIFTVNQTSGTKTFAGVVSGQIDFVKSGAGILNLTGTANTFSGNITINGGTFGIANAFINDTASVSIADGAVFALSFTGTDTIGTLTLGGIAQQTGTYGSLASSAQFKSAFFTGDGVLNVSTYAIPEPSAFGSLAGLAVFASAFRRRRSV